MADEHEMQVPGDAAAARAEGARGASGSQGAGESGGGAYPNPHNRNGHPQGFTGHGGQSDIDYHGPEQLGDEKIAGKGDANSATGRE